MFIIAHDAGGLRIVDIADLSHPIEEEKYINDSRFAITQVAYNIVAIYGIFAYATLDYCGLERIRLDSLPNLNQGQWYNPWNCEPSSWQGSPGHVNGISIDTQLALEFVSGGDTEIQVYDIDGNDDIIEIGRFQMLDDRAAVCIHDVRGDLIALGHLDNHVIADAGIPQPYYSNFGGIKLLR